MWWKPNTGNKHSPRSSKENFQHEEAFRRYGKNGTDTFRKALHVVTIKEPLTRLTSICKDTYGIYLDKTPWFGGKLCPQDIFARNGTARFVYFVAQQLSFHAMNALFCVCPLLYAQCQCAQWATVSLVVGTVERFL